MTESSPCPCQSALLGLCQHSPGISSLVIPTEACNALASEFAPPLVFVMALQFSAAYSSRVTKSRSKRASLKHSSSSPFSAFRQRKPVSRSHSKPNRAFADNEDLFDDCLEDCGLAASLAADLSLRDVSQILKYVRGHMFDEIPETGGGFNSVRIAEVLNFRKNLPPSVTVAHVHALSPNATTAEREIAELSRKGVVRKIVVPGRGTGRSSVSEGLVLSENLEDMVNRSGLERGVAGEANHPFRRDFVAKLRRQVLRIYQR